MKNLSHKSFVSLSVFIVYMSLYYNDAYALYAKDKATVKDKIEIADQLFNKKQYAASFKIYEAIYNEYKFYSPKMLLKMSMIKEQEGDISIGLFYLNEYYSKTQDRQARHYMQELGQKLGLKGYNIDDKEYISYFIEIYKKEIQIIFCIIILLTVGYIGFQQIVNHEMSTISLITLAIFLASLTAINYTTHNSQYLIVNKEQVRLMSQPSAGGDLLKELSYGDRYQVTNKQDVWWEVMYNDEKKGYVREQNVLAPRVIH